MEIFSPSLKLLWKQWDLRVIAVTSLILQIVLILLGNRRKHNHKLWIKIVLWCAYLSADSIATVALGVISNNLADLFDNNASYTPAANIELTAFWAPFLLLHLGGPDTITSYVLEDNELWLRHFIGLVVQTGITIYVFSMIWTGSLLSCLFIPMFFAGLIKYAERTWVLRAASSEKVREKFRKMMFTNEEDHVGERFFKQQEIKYEEGFIVEADMIPPFNFPVDLSVSNDNSVSEEDKLVLAFTLLEVTMGLFSDTILSSKVRDTTHYLFKNMSFENAFEIVDMEAGFTYDLLYTKAPLVYTRVGLTLHFITFFLSSLVSILFSTLLDHRKKYSKIDLIITFLLLGGAICLEIYAALVIVSSDRAVVWLWKHNKASTVRVPTCFQVSKGPRWANIMAQYSLLSFSLEKKRLPFRNFLKRLGIDTTIKTYLYVSYKDASIDFKKLFFEYLKEKAEGSRHRKISFPSLPDQKNKVASSRKPGEVSSFDEDLSKIIIFWHFVTEVSYYIDRGDESVKSEYNLKLMKRVSRYIIYLLVIYPSMLSVGITAVSFQNVAETLGQIFQEMKSKENITDRKRLCKKLLDSGRLEDRKKGVLSDAYLYMKQMKDEPVHEVKQEMIINKKWKEITCAWLEIFAYVASKCKGNLHAQQLRCGGELLTHVWLLMAQFGLTDHFQTSEELRIARLVSE